MLSKSFVVAAAFSGAILIGDAGGSLSAQSAPSTPSPAKAVAQTDGETPAYVRPETAEQRRERVGPVDPGPNPDESTKFFRYGKRYHISKYERKWAAFDQPEGYVRAYAGTPFVYEIYQMNKDWVWIWVQESDPEAEAAEEAAAAAAANSGKPEDTAPGTRYTNSQIEYLKSMLPEFTTLDVPSGKQTVVFEASSDGLPKQGSWRNSLDVADMNGDGFLDIVAPPQRGGGYGYPSIFLGDGKGHWKLWNVTWPGALDYGSVVAADFNKDGAMDLAFAVHLQGIHVFLGNGKGTFTTSSEGLPRTSWGSRRIVSADFNNDGYRDIAAISEGPTPEQQNTAPGGRVRVFLNRNRGKKWQSVDVVDPRITVGGDYLAVGKFNEDRIPDLISGSIYFGSVAIVDLSQKGKPVWHNLPPVDNVIPYLSLYFAVDAGRVSSKTLDDAFVSFVRHYPEDAVKVAGEPKMLTVVGIDRITFSGKDATRVPVLRIRGSRPIAGLRVADLDGDGKNDVIYTAFEPKREAVILKGDGKGGFQRINVEGLPLEDLSNYDLKLADVNRDGRLDVVINYESGAPTNFGPQGGSIQVFLNRGVKSDVAAAK